MAWPVRENTEIAEREGEGSSVPAGSDELGRAGDTNKENAIAQSALGEHDQLHWLPQSPVETWPVAEPGREKPRQATGSRKGRRNEDGAMRTSRVADPFVESGMEPQNSADVASEAAASEKPETTPPNTER